MLVNLYASHSAKVHDLQYAFCSQYCIWASPVATGGLLGAYPPQTRLQAPPNWNMKHYKSVEILSYFRVSNPPRTNAKPPRRNAKPPIGNFLATILTWARSHRGRHDDRASYRPTVFTRFGLYTSVTYFVRKFDALIRNNVYASVQRCEVSSNFFIRSLQFLMFFTNLHFPPLFNASAWRSPNAVVTGALIQCPYLF